jgi:hypothetical protein
VGEDHSSVIGVGLSLDPSLASEDVDVERGGSAGDGEAAGEFRGRQTLRSGGFQLEERKEGASRQIEVRESIDGRAVECARGSHELAEGREPGRLVRA